MRIPQRSVFGPAFLAAFLVSAAAAQEVLPPAGFALGWTVGGPPRIFVEKDLFNHIDGGAELFLEFGFVKLTVQPYAGEAGEELVLELYEMTEPAAALGIYLMNAGRETPWPEIPARNSSEEAQVIAVKGRHFLKVDNFEPGSALRPAMIALVRTVLALVPDLPLANPFAALPASGRVPGSERLVRGPVGLQPYYSFGEGDVLGLGGKTFAALGLYEGTDGLTFRRLVADYASADEAVAALKNLRANHDPYLTPLAGNDPDALLFSDYQKKFVRVRRRDSRVEIVFNAASPDGE